jgi:Raf kinase inhibitor-like YbhB/YbcL family protein
VPEPGSHAYDIQRTRLREEIDDNRNAQFRRTPDAKADEEANRLLRGEDPAPSPHKSGPRAGGPAGEGLEPGDPGPVLEVRSVAVTDGAPIPARCARDGGDEQPDLQWSPAPEGTHELVVLCVDPDAPTGTFLHWLVSGIDPGATGLDPSAPSGTAHPNGYGERGWGGPQPPVGDDAHRYVFRLYALAEPFAPPALDDPDGLRSWLDEHATSTGTLTGLYQR